MTPVSLFFLVTQALLLVFTLRYVFNLRDSQNGQQQDITTIQQTRKFQFRPGTPTQHDTETETRRISQRQYRNEYLSDGVGSNLDGMYSAHQRDFFESGSDVFQNLQNKEVFMTEFDLIVKKWGFRNVDMKSRPGKFGTPKSGQKLKSDASESGPISRRRRANQMIKSDFRHGSRLKSRQRRATSKFTGLAVGSSTDRQLSASVRKTIKEVEGSIWGQQLQVTQQFNNKDNKAASILGAFPSEIVTNFHGKEEEIKLRRDPSYAIPDLNSLTTLLVVQCLAEATIYGNMDNPSVNNMAKAIDALEEFHSHSYDRTSSIMTLWPERAGTKVDGWISYPGNIIQSEVKGGTTFNQLQNLVKSCDCEPARLGLAQISSNQVCKSHFSTAFSEIVFDVATPPDFMTSFSNLALGSLFQAYHPGSDSDKGGIFKTELKLWQHTNSGISQMIAKLKQMAIIFPAKVRTPTPSGSSQTIPVNVTAAIKMEPVKISTAQKINTHPTRGDTGGSTSSTVGVQTRRTADEMILSGREDQRLRRSSGRNHKPRATNDTQNDETMKPNSKISTTQSEESTKTSQTLDGEPDNSTDNGTSGAMNHSQQKPSGDQNFLLAPETNEISNSQVSQVQGQGDAGSDKTIGNDSNIITTSGNSSPSEKSFESSNVDKNSNLTSGSNEKNDSETSEDNSQQEVESSKGTLVEGNLNNLSNNNNSSVNQTNYNGDETDKSDDESLSHTADIKSGKQVNTVVTTDGREGSTEMGKETNDAETKSDATKTEERTEEQTNTNVNQTSLADKSPKSSEKNGPVSSIKPGVETVSSENVTSMPKESNESGDKGSNTSKEKESHVPKKEESNASGQKGGHPITTIKEPRINQILDSLSYYSIRRYLDDVIPDGQDDVILIPLMISDGNSSTNNGDVLHNDHLFHSYNSVDLTSTATTIHAIILSSMTGLVDIQADPDLQKIMTSSLRLLTWFMTHQSDLTSAVQLSPFPSRFQLFWIASRIAFQVSSTQATDAGIFKFAEKEITSFVETLRKKMTYAILESIKDGGLAPDGKTRVYIDDFIGASDLNNEGQQKVSQDDRLFTSAMATNALISTWSKQMKDGSLVFDPDTKDPVRIAIKSLVNYITGSISKTSPLQANAFMGEQIKDCQTLPVWYPSNIITSREGKQATVTKPADFTKDLRYGVKGYIPKDKYEEQLQNPPSGHKLTKFDINSPTSLFRFWKSEAYTKAACLLAIAQSANLEKKVG